MLVETTCAACGGTGKLRREIRVGDVITPQDGSGMCDALHMILFLGVGKGFKPVKVVAIEGNMLGVEPVHWGNEDTMHKEMYHGDNPVGASTSWIWKGTYTNNEALSRNGFWIDAHISNLKEMQY